MPFLQNGNENTSGLLKALHEDYGNLIQTEIRKLILN